MPPIVIQPIAIRPTTIEFHICDHTATVEIKVWTSVMDIILTACGIAAPEQGVGDKDKLIETLRSKCWSCRCIIVEETAYANRPERNRLQMVSIVEQSWKFKGTKRGLFALNPEYSRSGLPYVFAKDVTVDAADQVLDDCDDARHSGHAAWKTHRERDPSKSWTQLCGLWGPNWQCRSA